MKPDYVIDRSKWVCGQKVKQLGFTQLLNNKGRMCCLGQICKQDGWRDEELLHRSFPCSLLGIDACALVDRNGEDTLLATRAMDINDSAVLNQEDRERALTELFSRHGFTIEFTGVLLP